jgi:hypothetical protein
MNESDKTPDVASGRADDKSFSSLKKGGEGFRMRWVSAGYAAHLPRFSHLTPALSPRWAERESAGNVPHLLTLSRP